MLYIRSLSAAVAYLAMVAPSLANHRPDHLRPRNGPKAVSVPEIDVSAGLLAAAGLATILLLLWERNRRLGARQGG